MNDFEKYINIKSMSELFAYEIYYIYLMEKTEIDNLEYIFNALSSHLIFNQYKNEIMELGTTIAKVLFEVPIKKDSI